MQNGEASTMETGTSARPLLERLLAGCVRYDASDLHLAANLPPYYRIHGILSPEEAAEVLPAEALEGVAAELMRGFDEKGLARTGSVDGAISAADGTRFRFN